MRLKKLGFIILVVLVSLMLVLAGCSSNGAGGTDDENDQETTDTGDDDGTTDDGTTDDGTTDDGTTDDGTTDDGTTGDGTTDDGTTDDGTIDPSTGLTAGETAALSMAMDLDTEHFDSETGDVTANPDGSFTISGEGGGSVTISITTNETTGAVSYTVDYDHYVDIYGIEYDTPDSNPYKLVMTYPEDMSTMTTSITGTIIMTDASFDPDVVTTMVFDFTTTVSMSTYQVTYSGSVTVNGEVVSGDQVTAIVQ